MIIFCQFGITSLECLAFRPLTELLVRWPFAIDLFGGGGGGGSSLWEAGVCILLWGIWGERNNRIFRVIEREAFVVWPLVRFNVFLWALMTKSFCNYFPGFILLDWSSFL